MDLRPPMQTNFPPHHAMQCRSTLGILSLEFCIEEGSSECNLDSCFVKPESNQDVPMRDARILSVTIYLPRAPLTHAFCSAKATANLVAGCTRNLQRCIRLWFSPYVGLGRVSNRMKCFGITMTHHSQLHSCYCCSSLPVSSRNEDTSTLLRPSQTALETGAR